MNLCKYCGKSTKNAIFCSSACYGFWQKGKRFTEQAKTIRPKKHCSIYGCNKIHFGKDYCRKHYIEIVNPKRYEPKTVFQCEYCGVAFNANKRTGKRTPRFCSFKCMGLFNRKPYIIKKGYKKLLIPDHPRADKKGYVFEHIVVLESVLGRTLKNGEETHHIDGNRGNNSPSNLMLCSSHAVHMKQSHARPPKVIE